jgi:hypothetical protein
MDGGAIRDLRYGAANGDFSPADALRPDWTTPRSLLQQDTGTSQPSLPWNAAQQFGIPAGFGNIGNYGATLPAGF